MDRPSQLLQPLELVPIDEGSSNSDVAGDIAGGDKYVARATREIDRGLVNRPLWTRALAESNGDKPAARDAYIRARAAELRLGKADAADAAPQAEPPHPAPPAATAPAPKTVRGVVAGRAPPHGSRARVYGAVAIALLGIAAVAVVFTGEGNDPRRTRSVPTSAPPKAPTAANVDATQPAPPADDASAALRARVMQLAEAGNWNVLVLNASEWTRKETQSADAWRHLAVGYAKLHQFDEALAAATKVAQLAPDDASAWRAQGEAAVAASDLPAAAQAFERAAALDGNDLQSAVHAGMLDLELDRTAEAAVMFDKVLAAKPGNVEALCGHVSVARRQNRPRDVEATTRQVAALGARCGDPTESATVAVKSPVGRATAVR